MSHFVTLQQETYKTKPTKLLKLADQGNAVTCFRYHFAELDTLKHLIFIWENKSCNIFFQNFGFFFPYSVLTKGRKENICSFFNIDNEMDSK